MIADGIAEQCGINRFYLAYGVAGCRHARGVYATDRAAIPAVHIAVPGEKALAALSHQDM